MGYNKQRGNRREIMNDRDLEENAPQLSLHS
jgi:hypothetical protein